MAIKGFTLVPRPNAENSDHNELSTLLAIDGNWKNNRDSIVARYKGIKAAKDYALAETNKLLKIGRWLSIAVIFVSAIHIWESLSKISPGFVPNLQLYKEVYYGAALLFTILIDAVALYILKAKTALAYTKAAKDNSIVFFYIVTALLNGAFIVSNSPDATLQLKNTLIEVYGNLFIILLPLTVPVALWAIERSNQRLEAGKIVLTVDIATLDGLIESNVKENKEPVQHQDNRTLVINQVLESDTYPDKVLPALTCAKCNALLPTTGNVKKDRGVWLSTHRFGCDTCKKEKAILEHNNQV